jgi:hypothetical protein
MQGAHVNRLNPEQLLIPFIADRNQMVRIQRAQSGSSPLPTFSTASVPHTEAHSPAPKLESPDPPHTIAP